MFRSAVKLGAKTAIRTGASGVETAATNRAFRGGAAQSLRQLEKGEIATAVEGGAKNAEQSGKTIINNTPGWKSATAKAVGAIGVQVGGGVIAHETLKGDFKELGQAVGDGLDKIGTTVADAGKDAISATMDGAKGASNSLLSKAEDVAEHLPSSTEIASGITSVTSTVMPFVVGGLVIFVAYEIYQFSR